MARWTRTALAGAVILAMTTACFFGGDDEGKDDQAATAAAAGGGGDDDEGSGGGGSTEIEIPWRTVDKPPLSVSDFEASYERNFLRRGTKIMKMAFKAKAEAKSDDSRMARVKTTCKFGDELLVETSSLGGSDLKELEVGQTKKLDTRLYSNPGIEDLPEACEVTIMVGAIIDTKKPVLVAQRCVQGEKVSEGTCDAIERPKANADGSTVTPYDVKVENDTMGFGAKKKKHITAEFKARVERQEESIRMLDVKSACQVGGETLVDTTTALGSLSQLLPGEAVHMRVMPFAQEGLDSEPSECTLAVRKKVGFNDTEDLAEFCWKGEGEVSKGGC